MSDNGGLEKTKGGVEPVATKSLTLATAKKRLAKELGDSEGYHSVFDDLIEEKLAEYDPKFMKALHKLYDTSGESRWYA